MRHAMTDEHWDAIEDIFPEPARTGRPPMSPRNAMNAIIWLNNTGAKWRDLPKEFGKWRTVYGWFDLWNGNGTLQKVVDRLTQLVIDEGGLAEDIWCIDGTVLRAHRCAAGGGKKGIPTNPTTTLWGVLAGDLRQNSTC